MSLTPSSFKLLVANRSEIACRVFQTCREMGIRTVGIVAPGDEEARHVTYADEIYQVAHYLDTASILQVAHLSGTRLIHPGYGFLSERPNFARAVEAEGLVFIGPRAETMELMGEKIAAKQLAEKEKIPTLPWAKVEVGGDLVQAASRVGYPLLLKASSGGGGKGMRRVNQPAELEAAAESASAEAQAAFGSGTLFLERLLDRPRHIEVQIFGDGRGGGVHLYERDCSLQRRHQKIWEESPAPVLQGRRQGPEFELIRDRLFEAALRLVRATQYRNAGTVEFLVDAEGGIYFLEMNTRLQVEHPVTEWVTGIDLVWAQIAQAMAPEQSVLSDSPSLRGHSIEVRLYAEDPAQGFIPTPGRISRLKWPTGAGIRVESGIEEGQSVGTQFDSLLGKLIVWAENRDRALDRLRFALEETVILGIGSNQNYLRHLLDLPQVREGNFDTEFLSREPFSPVPTQEDLEVWQAAQMSFTQSVPVAQKRQSPSPWRAFFEPLRANSSEDHL